MFSYLVYILIELGVVESVGIDNMGFRSTHSVPSRVPAGKTWPEPLNLNLVLVLGFYHIEEEEARRRVWLNPENWLYYPSINKIILLYIEGDFVFELFGLFKWDRFHRLNKNNSKLKIELNLQWFLFDF